MQKDFPKLTPAQWHERNYGVTPDKADDSVKTKEFGKLLEVASSKGYKPGWAAYKFKDLYGHFPPKSWNE
jgi:hypothetical protein